MEQDNAVTIGKLIISNECMPPYTEANIVADRFLKSAHLDAVALVEGREPIGLVTRHKLLFKLFKRYGFELYGKKPIIALTDTEPLIIHKDERLDVAIDKALERQAQDAYDDAQAKMLSKTKTSGFQTAMAELKVKAEPSNI